ncbi:MAG: CoA-binding protein, partial [Thermodesulfobacteriota bacterium]|nr:CoA-binding protein [Thermodesulfobacteriota bacterium]
MSRHSLESIFHPESIAVIGASGSPFSLGYHFVRHLVDYGYSGKIYPVNPKLGEVFGRKVYGSLKEVPGSV